VFALPVEASLIGPQIPHISMPKALVCLIWVSAFVPRLLAPSLRLAAIACSGAVPDGHPAAQGRFPTTSSAKCVAWGCMHLAYSRFEL
jgi:hypothetical protein